MLAAAGQFVDTEGLGNVVLTKDDLFASKLESSAFDLVHARFQIAPLGRGPDQISNHVMTAPTADAAPLVSPPP